MQSHLVQNCQSHNFQTSVTFPTAVFITHTHTHTHTHVIFHMKQYLLTCRYSYRWSRNSSPYVIAGKFIALFTKAVHFYCVPSQLIPTRPFLPVPCLLTICFYSRRRFPQVPAPFVQFPVFRNKYVLSECCRHFSISSG